MKKLFILTTIFALMFMVSCSDDYDDEELWNSVNSLEQRMSALETVMQAHEKGLNIRSVVETNDGYVITFSDGSQAVIKNGRDGIDGQDGHDGADGQDGQNGHDGVDGHDGIDGQDGQDGTPLIDHITISDVDVKFVLTDGTSFSIPLYYRLSISFAENDLKPVAPNSTRLIHFTIETLIPEVDVEIVTSSDIKAKLIRDSKTSLEGVIEVKTGDVVDEYSKVVVLASNGEKTIMKGLHFEQIGLKEYDETHKEVPSEGGELVLDVLSNVKCVADIEADGQKWITAGTRALTRQQLSFNVSANEGKKRTTHITVRTEESNLKIVFDIVQKSGLPAEQITMETGGYNFGNEAVFAIKCNTHNACLVSYKKYLTSELNQILSSGSTNVNDYVMKNKETFTDVSEENLILVNNVSGEHNQGLWIPFDAVPDEEYSMLYYVEEENGGYVTGRIDTDIYNFTVFGWVGDRNGKRTFDCATFNILCGKKITKARYFYGNLDDYDFYESFAEGMGMDNMGHVMTDKQIKEINSREGLFIEGYSKPVSWTGVVVELTYADGKVEYMRDKVQLDGLVNSQGGPDVILSAKNGDAAGKDPSHMVTFNCVSNSKNVAGAFYNMLTTEELNMQVDWYFMTLYEVGLTNCTLITDIDKLNSDGINVELKGLYPETDYSLIVVTWDENGNYTESRYDITTKADEQKSKVINIPDQNFKNYLVSHFDTDGDFEISENEAMKITEIHADGQDIASLEGVEKFTHLQVLDCSSNRITSLDMSHNFELVKLVCSYNQILQMDLSQNTELNYLDCSSNKLSSLDIFNSTNIKELNCSFNALGELQIQNNMFIENLYCAGCCLSSLNLGMNYQIKELDCSQNKLSELNVSGLGKMVKLNCSNNSISELKTGKMYNLTSLKCASNNITSLNLKNNYLLNLLFCGANKMSELDISYNNAITKLNTLDSKDLKTIWVWSGFNADDYKFKIDSWTSFKEKQ